MKTCSYRGAQPRSLNQGHSEGLFCVHPPEARTSFLPCTHEPCRCCWERRDLTGRPQPCVRFSPVHSYQFLNGYQVLLNCPAVSILFDSTNHREKKKKKKKNLSTL